MTGTAQADEPTAARLRGADPTVVGPYLADVLHDERWTSCSATLVSGGRSNLTFVVRSPAGEVVLRRPPLRHLLPTAHDMGREFRVISALAATPVPVPRALHLCTDPSLIGAPFYLMERVLGHVVRDRLPDGYAETAADRRRIGAALVDTLAALHRQPPPEVGLADFGRPDGFLGRQLGRWSRQWELSRTAELPELDRLRDELTAALPDRPDATIVHGDFRLDNVVLHPVRPGGVQAVLDWELSTLGDPLLDLGTLLVYWVQPGDPPERRGPVPAVTGQPGFPTRAEVVDRYAAATGRDVSRVAFYTAFGFFKLAVICQGIVARVAAGAMLGPGFEGFAERVPALVAAGRATLSRGAIG